MAVVFTYSGMMVPLKILGVGLEREGEGERGLWQEAVMVVVAEALWRPASMGFGSTGSARGVAGKGDGWVLAGISFIKVPNIPLHGCI